MRIETAKRLHDALTAATKIQEIVALLEPEIHESLEIRQLAIERLLAIIGEALNRAIQSDKSLNKSIPDAPIIIGMRNRIIHGYDVIRDDVIWDAARNDIPKLIQQLTTLLELNPPPPE